MTDAKNAAFGQVEHIVALVLENRSFDHLLGDLGRSGGLALDGGNAGMSNPDLNGNAIPIAPTIGNVSPDLPHEFDDVIVSLMDDNRGFVLAAQLHHLGLPAAAASRVMSYYAADSLPVTHALAREYSTSDAWFASVPAGTWPNRLFLLAGTSDGQVTNTLPILLYDLPTVFDALERDEWAIYNDQLPNVAIIRSLAIEYAKSKVADGHFRSMRQFAVDCAEASLPAFAFIEPAYLGDAHDDAHPPGDILRSERLLGRVYTALRRSPLWERSLLLVFYDEHGGFFDHVRPPSGVPSPGDGAYGFDFTRLGVRVPSLIVSPFAPRGGTFRPQDGGFLDHTALIATVLRQRGLPALTARDGAAADVWAALSEAAPRTDDETTVKQVSAWLEAQDSVLMRDVVGPLDPRLLGERSGREIAAAIVASAPAPTGAGVSRAGGEASAVDATARHPRDVSLEEALLTLSQAVLTLPPELPPSA
jgi:phospholipase C